MRHETRKRLIGYLRDYQVLSGQPREISARMLSVLMHMPQPSLRRCIHELRRAGWDIKSGYRGYSLPLNHERTF